MEEESQETTTEKKAEPQILSSDPEERKLARRLRIQRRNESIRRATQLAEGVSLEDEGPQQTPLEEQVEKSAVELERLLLEGRELVTNVRIANDSREVARRLDEAEKRRARTQRLEDDVESTKEMYEEVQKKWKELTAASDPMDLKAEIDSQKAKCDELIKRKDEVIEQLRSEVDDADARFTKDQKKQKLDIAMLVERIENHVRVMKESFRNELQFIEDAISVERTELIESTNEKWQSLFSQRADLETANLSQRFEDINSQEKEVDALRTQFREKYRKTKIELETELQDMQKEMEKVKACCLLNSEKLDYNYQVLQKREEENIVMRAQQKRRLNKLQDTVTNLRRKIRMGKQAAEQEAARLDVEVSRLHDNILDIERKADHFANMNDKKYHQVWSVNESTAKSLVERIFSIDKIISEQQLGLDWEPPDMVIPDKTSLPSFRSAVQLVSEAFDEESKSGKSDYANVKKEKEGVEEKMDEEKEPKTEDSKDKRRGSATIKTVEEREADEIQAKAVRARLMKHILQRIADASGFLVENRLQKLLSPYSPPERAVVLLDNVFDALGLRFEADVELLKEYFIPYATCTDCPPPDYDSEETQEAPQAPPEGDQREIPPICVESFEDDAAPLEEHLQVQSFTTAELSECSGGSIQEREAGTTEKVQKESGLKVGEAPQTRSRPASVSSGGTLRELPLPRRGDTFQQSDTTFPIKVVSAVAEPQQAESSSTRQPLVETSYDESFISVDEGQEVLPLPKCPVPPAKACVERHKLEIEPIYVYMALNDFVTKFHNNEMADLQSIARILARKRNTVSRLITNEDTAKFWDAYKNVLPIERQRLWSGFLKGLNKYYHVLSERHKLNMEAMALQRQNEELRQLLSAHMKHSGKPESQQITLPPLRSRS